MGKDSLPRGFDVLCVGFATHDVLAAVEGYPPPDTKVEVLELDEQGGGPAATAAVAIARLGGRVAFLSAVGEDDLGGRTLAELAREGVDVSRCVRPPGARSAMSLIVVDRPAGTRNVFRYSGTALLAPAQVDPALVGSARVLLVDTHMPAAALEAARLARAAGVPVVLDTGTPKPEVHPLLAVADYPIPPAATALWATGESEPERAALALLRGPARAVVLTMGAEGHLVATPQGVWRESAFRVEVVDTTGAGDAFHGGFAFAIARGMAPGEAARFAAAVAALKCRGAGGRGGLPTLEEVRELLARQPGGRV